MTVTEQIEEIAKSMNRSRLVRKQVTDKNGHRRTVWVRPDEQKKGTGRLFSVKELEDRYLDTEYMNAIKSGDMEKVQKMVMDRAEKMGFKNAIPEQGNGYKVRVTAPPKKTKTYYKCFYVDENGRPSALFVDNNAALPTNVWLNANDTYHFKADNGSFYVPTMGNATNKDAGKTGVSIAIPNDQVRNELIERGYLPKGSTAKSVTCVVGTVEIFRFSLREERKTKIQTMEMYIDGIKLFLKLKQTPITIIQKKQEINRKQEKRTAQ